jgi:hypothetical protein
LPPRAELGDFSVPSCDKNVVSFIFFYIQGVICSTFRFYDGVVHSCAAGGIRVPHARHGSVNHFPFSEQ